MNRLCSTSETAVEEPCTTDDARARDYEPPFFVELGPTSKLIRQDINGHLKDGNGGWWVWGS
jgi:hypothetical protein